MHMIFLRNTWVLAAYCCRMRKNNFNHFETARKYNQNLAKPFGEKLKATKKIVAILLAFLVLKPQVAVHSVIFDFVCL